MGSRDFEKVKKSVIEFVEGHYSDMDFQYRLKAAIEYLTGYLGDKSITGNQIDDIYNAVANIVSSDEKADNDYCKLHDC